MVKTYIGSDLIKKVYIGTEKVKKIFIGTEQVYSASHIVTFHFLNDALAEDTVEVEVDDGADALLNAPPLPQRFSPTWALTGWREDTVASPTVLQSKVITTDNVHLYAVIQRTLTLSYNANGGSGSVASQTGTQYHNNGNSTSVSITLRANGYARTYHRFDYWNIGSPQGTAVGVGGVIQISNNTIAYAHWTQNYWPVFDGEVSSSVSYYDIKTGASVPSNAHLYVKYMSHKYSIGTDCYEWSGSGWAHHFNFNAVPVNTYTNAVELIYKTNIRLMISKIASDDYGHVVIWAQL